MRARNNVTAVPNSITKLSGLAHLDLRSNSLVSLPPSLGDLANLEKLNLRWNEPSGEPAWIKRLEQRGCIVLQ